MKTESETLATSEQKIADFLNKLPDSDPFWESVDLNFDHQFCFADFSCDEIKNDKEIAKEWLKTQLLLLGESGSKRFKNLLRKYMHGKKK